MQWQFLDQKRKVCLTFAFHLSFRVNSLHFLYQKMPHWKFDGCLHKPQNQQSILLWYCLCRAAAIAFIKFAIRENQKTCLLIFEWFSILWQWHALHISICIENPFLLGFTNAFAKGAKLNGASILEDCPVTKINVDSDNNVQSVTVGHEQVNNFISF